MSLTRIITVCMRQGVGGGGGEGGHNYFLAQNHEPLQQGWGLLMGGHEKRINYDIYYVKGFSERVGMKNGSIMI